VGAVVASKGAKVLDEDLGWFHYVPDDDDDDGKDGDEDQAGGKARAKAAAAAKGDVPDGGAAAVATGAGAGAGSAADASATDVLFDVPLSLSAGTRAYAHTRRPATGATDERLYSTEERLQRMRQLYERVLAATRAQAHAADQEWERHVLESTERTLERGLAVLSVRAPVPTSPAS
jgi:hypothetical protein